MVVLQETSLAITVNVIAHDIILFTVKIGRYINVKQIKIEYSLFPNKTVSSILF